MTGGRPPADLGDWSDSNRAWLPRADLSESPDPDRSGHRCGCGPRVAPARHPCLGGRRPAQHEPVHARRRERRPVPTGVVLWTRLALSPLADNGKGGMSTSTTVALAGVPGRAVPHAVQVRDRGSATSANAHSVHVEVTGLLPGREYCYRFRLGGYCPRSAAPGPRRRSPVAWRPWRCRSPPAPIRARLVHGVPAAGRGPAGPGAPPGRLPVRVQGQCATWRRAATSVIIRGPETVTLADYRQRHAQYKPTRISRQRTPSRRGWWSGMTTRSTTTGPTRSRENAGQSAPGLPGAPGRGVPGVLREHAAAAGLGPRRARHAALPPDPMGPAGQLPHARHPAVPRRSGVRRRVQGLPRAADDPARSSPAPSRRSGCWTASGSPSARWDIIGQQVFFGRRDSNRRRTTTVSMDGWDGYPASRRADHPRLGRRQVRNPSCSPATCTPTGPPTSRWTTTTRTAAWWARNWSCSSITSGGDGNTSRPASTMGGVEPAPEVLERTCAAT